MNVVERREARLRRPKSRGAAVAGFLFPFVLGALIALGQFGGVL